MSYDKEEIHLFQKKGVWFARFINDQELIDLIGTDEIPTPYNSTTPFSIVQQALQKKNPNANIHEVTK